MTLDQWRDRLADYLAAEKRILQSQEYMIGNGGTARRNRRADLEQVRIGIRECREQIAQLQAAASGCPRTIRLRPY